MLYFVEIQLKTMDVFEEFDSWVEHHLDILMDIEGFYTAQRFVRIGSISSVMHIYSLSSPKVLDSESYKKRAGPSQTEVWRPRFRSWTRLAFGGIDVLPEILPKERLVVRDRTLWDPNLPAEYQILKSEHFPTSIEERGILIGSRNLPARDDDHVRHFRPLRTQRVSAAYNTP